MIVDCFTFFNEFDLLELRLRMLEGVVDRFVLCEAPFTFRGAPKPLYFAQAADRFARWRDRITVLTYPGPVSDEPWRNEWGQRDYLATALADCAPGDLVLVGDCDEIPDPQSAARAPATRAIAVHKMLQCSGYVNRALAVGPAWLGTRALTRATLARYASLSDVRKRPVDELDVIEGGWHFSSLGGSGVMEQKMRSYSHREFDIPYFRDRRRLEVEFASRGVWLPLDERFPAELRTSERWRRYVWAAPAAERDQALDRAREHAHGAFAYVADHATPVAVIAPEPGVWPEVGAARFGTAFAGTFPNADALLAQVAQPAWVVLDGLERLAEATLAVLAQAGASAVVYAVNARSFGVFSRVLDLGGPFPPGRALGRAECERAAAAAGYRIDVFDRSYTREVAIPSHIPENEAATVGNFTFAQPAPHELEDFLADAFVFALRPVKQAS